jgi:hypothetical protein
MNKRLRCSTTTFHYLRDFESMSKGAVELGEFEPRESRHEMSQLTLEHQGEEIAADRAGAWQAVFRSQHDFGRESEDYPSSHKRACSAISARAWRARRLRWLRNTAPSLASRACLRTLSAYWRSAVRTSAARLRRRDDVSVSASRSFEVASSIAIVFMRGIISALLDCAQGFGSVPLAKADGVIK